MPNGNLPEVKNGNNEEIGESPPRFEGLDSGRHHRCGFWLFRLGSPRVPNVPGRTTDSGENCGGSWRGTLNPPGRRGWAEGISKQRSHGVWIDIRIRY